MMVDQASMFAVETMRSVRILDIFEGRMNRICQWLGRGV